MEQSGLFEDSSGEECTPDLCKNNDFVKKTVIQIHKVEEFHETPINLNKNNIKSLDRKKLFKVDLNDELSIAKYKKTENLNNYNQDFIDESIIECYDNFGTEIAKKNEEEPTTSAIKVEKQQNEQMAEKTFRKLDIKKNESNIKQKHTICIQISKRSGPNLVTDSSKTGENQSDFNTKDALKIRNIQQKMGRKRLNFETGALETDSDSSKPDQIKNIDVETGDFKTARNSQQKNGRKRLNYETGDLETDSETDDIVSNLIESGKKRKSRPHTWKKKREVSDKLKDHKLNEIPWCRCNCKNKLTKAEIESNFNKFINLKSHTEQNIYLQGCIKEEIPKSYRPRKKGITRRVFKYTVVGEKGTIQVCQKAFISIHDIKPDRLVCKVKRPDKDIRDGRGLNSGNNKYTENIINTVHNFIENLPTRVSHYSPHTNKHVKYLNPQLNIANIHRRFLRENLDSTVTYNKFREIFNTHFNIVFGNPRKDFCETCNKYKVDIEAAEVHRDDEKVKELELAREVHSKKAEVFLKKISDCEMEKLQTTLSICFDYQNNLPLPLTNEKDEYYMRQLWLHNFGIHNLGDNSASMYLYTENFAQKGPNEVISALNDYICSHKTGDQTHLEIFCNNCVSQNKNKYMFTFLDQICALGIFESVSVNYPLPGHSLMPIDRDFAFIERKITKHKKLYTPEYYLNLIKDSRKYNKFEIIFLEKNLRLNILKERIVKVKNYKKLYDDGIQKTVAGISQCRRIVFKKQGRPKISDTMQGEDFKSVILYKLRVPRVIKVLPENCFDAPIKIKKSKLNDVLKLLEYVPENERAFYNDLFINDGIEISNNDESETEVIE